MSKRILTYNGVDLSTFGAHVSGEGVWAKPAPEYERISVPGRSGDVLLYNGRYSNVDITYRFGITKNFDTNYTNLIAALLGSPGYHKLVDSKHPGVYRMAAIDRGIEPTMLPQLSAGEFEVVFNCKPQIYLDSGDEAITMWDKTKDSPGWTIGVTNPTNYTSYPLIKITTTSNSPADFEVPFTIYDYRYCRYKALDSGTITNPIVFDAENGDVYESGPYKKSLNNNAYVADIVILGKRSLDARIDAAYKDIISKIEIVPRWWTL